MTQPDWSSNSFHWKDSGTQEQCCDHFFCWKLIHQPDGQKFYPPKNKNNLTPGISPCSLPVVWVRVLQEIKNHQLLRTLQGIDIPYRKAMDSNGIPYKVGFYTSFINKDPITPFIVVKFRPQIAMYFFGHLKGVQFHSPGPRVRSYRPKRSRGSKERPPRQLSIVCGAKAMAGILAACPRTKEHIPAIHQGCRR